jgi:tetratricopeptide (TPR) repeat protein
MFSVKKLSIIFLIALLPSLSAADSADSKLLAEGRVDDAIASLQRRISKAPNDAESYNLLCRAYFTLSEWDKGISGCEKAVSLDPGNAQYHLWLGRLYGEKADHSHFLAAAGLAKKVRGEFETAVRLNPNSAEARTDLAEFYLEAPGIVGGGRDKAEAQAKKLAAMDPVKAGWVKGRLAEKKKDLVSAENQYRAAIEASHGAALAWLNLAFFYRHTTRLDAMEDAIRHASSAPMNQPEVLMEGAEMLLRSKRDVPQATQLLHSHRGSRARIQSALPAGNGARAARRQTRSSSGIPRIAFPGQELRFGSDCPGPGERPSSPRREFKLALTMEAGRPRPAPRWLPMLRSGGTLAQKLARDPLTMCRRGDVSMR